MAPASEVPRTVVVLRAGSTGEEALTTSHPTLAFTNDTAAAVSSKPGPSRAGARSAMPGDFAATAAAGATAMPVGVQKQAASASAATGHKAGNFMLSQQPPGPNGSLVRFQPCQRGIAKCPLWAARVASLLATEASPRVGECPVGLQLEALKYQLAATALRYHQSARRSRARTVTRTGR